MCVEWNGDWEIADEDIIAWKIVRIHHDWLGDGSRVDSFRSMYSPPMRVSQDDESNGFDYTYKFGELMEDRGFWGYYLYRNLHDVKCAAAARRRAGYSNTLRILQVKIPKGSKYRLSWYRLSCDSMARRCINSMTIEVLDIEASE